jgi:sarcosine oxidase subunit delta
MRISCPHCGPRGHDEFTYHGDATVRRPDPSATNVEVAFDAYLHLRDNPAGLHQEFWYHAGGCQAWLVVERDTLTHAIRAVRPARISTETAS